MSRLLETTKQAAVFMQCRAHKVGNLITEFRCLISSAEFDIYQDFLYQSQAQSDGGGKMGQMCWELDK